MGNCSFLCSFLWFYSRRLGVAVGARGDPRGTVETRVEPRPSPGYFFGGSFDFLVVFGELNNLARASICQLGTVQIFTPVGVCGRGLVAAFLVGRGSGACCSWLDGFRFGVGCGWLCGV